MGIFGYFELFEDRNSLTGNIIRPDEKT